jgi:hypothetical protein
MSLFQTRISHKQDKMNDTYKIGKKNIVLYRNYI